MNTKNLQEESVKVQTHETNENTLRCIKDNHGWKLSCDGCNKMFEKQRFRKSLAIENGNILLCNDCFEFQKKSETILSFVWNP